MVKLEEFTTYKEYPVYKNMTNGKLCFKRDDGSYSSEAHTLKTIEWLINRYMKETSLAIGTKIGWNRECL